MSVGQIVLLCCIGVPVTLAVLWAVAVCIAVTVDNVYPPD